MKTRNSHLNILYIGKLRSLLHKYTISSLPPQLQSLKTPSTVAKFSRLVYINPLFLCGMKLSYFAAIYNFIQVKRPMKSQHFGIEVSPYEASESPLFEQPGQPLLIRTASVPKSHGDNLAAELRVHLPWRTE